MISLNESRGAQCDVRLSLKTQDQTLMRQAMDGWCRPDPLGGI